MDVKLLYIGLGSNLEDRLALLAEARRKCALSLGPILKRSDIYYTTAWGKRDQAAFLNQIIQIQTLLEPLEVIASIQDIEKQMGRRRTEKWGPRKIDIDLLFYDQLVMKDEVLIVPHPGIHERRFVLQPFMDIDPHFVHPQSKKTISDLLDSCKDDGEVITFNHLTS